MKNSLILIFLAVAIIAAAVSAFVVSQNRRDIAIAEQAKAQANESAEMARQKSDEAKKAAEEAAERKVKAENERLEKEADAANAALLADEAERKKLKEQQVLADTEAKAVAAQLKAASESRAAEEAKLKAAKVEKETEALRLKRAEAEAEKAESLRQKAEADALVVRNSLTELDLLKAEYANRLSELQTLQSEVEEMKRALAPEKTVTDLISLGDDEPTNAVQVVQNETNWLDTPADRSLAALEGERDRRLDETMSRTRTAVVGALENLLSRAIDERRPIDAQFYFKTIKSLYPDWSYHKEIESK